MEQVRRNGILQPLSVSDPRHLPGTKRAIPATPRAKMKLRPGRKPKPLEERVYRHVGPIQRVERTYSREKKVEVLMFLTHHRVPKDSHCDWLEYRPPTQMEASKWFKIPQRTIACWWRDRVDIIGQKIGSRRQPNATWLCMWPLLEMDLFEQFVHQRQAVTAELHAGIQTT